MHDDDPEEPGPYDRRWRDPEYLTGRIHARLARMHRLAMESARLYAQGQFPESESLARTVLSCTLTELYEPLTPDEIADWERQEQWFRGLTGFCWAYLGLSRWRQDDTDGGLAALRYACLADPHEPRHLLTLAALEARQWRVGEAWGHFVEGMRLRLRRLFAEQRATRPGHGGPGEQQPPREPG